MSAVLNSVYKFTKFSKPYHRQPKTTYSPQETTNQDAPEMGADGG